MTPRDELADVQRWRPLVPDEPCMLCSHDLCTCRVRAAEFDADCDRLAARLARLEAAEKALREIASSETLLSTPGVLDNRSFSGLTAQRQKAIARAALAVKEETP